MPQAQSVARGIASRTALCLFAGRLLLVVGYLVAGAGVVAEFFKLRHVAFRDAHVGLESLLGAGVVGVVP